MSHALPASRSTPPVLARLVWGGLITLLATLTQLYHLGQLWPVPKYDPAMNAVDAWRVIHGGVFPLFFPANGGREPLFIYLQTLSLWALGFNTFALRLPGALAGLLAVPALFGLGRALLSDADRQLRAWAPVWAALALALSAWYVSQTRLGLRAALLPLVSTIAFWLLIAGWRRLRLVPLVMAGGVLGLAAYTYTAARLLPLVVVLTLLPDLLRRPLAGEATRRRRWLGIGLMGLAALAVFAPLGWYYLSHPAMFAERAASIMVWNVWKPDSGSSLVEELALNLGRVLLMFVRLPVPLALGWALGMLVALRRVRQLEYRLLLIWWAVMLLPTVVTIEAPHLLRSLGAAPPSYLLIGIGLAKGAGWLARQCRIPPRRLAAAGTALVLLGSYPLWAYFHPDAKDPLAKVEALAHAALTRARQGVVYLPLSSYAHPSLRFLLADHFPPRAAWAPGAPPAASFLLEASGASDWRSLVRLSPEGQAMLLPAVSSNWLAALRAEADAGQPVLDRYGTNVGRLIELPARLDPAQYLASPQVSADAEVESVARLVGYSLETSEAGGTIPRLKPGGPLWVNTFWQAVGPTGEDDDLTLYLIDDAGRRWGQADGPPLTGAYPTSLWRAGEQVADGRLLWVDPNAPVGRYWLALAFYDATTGRRLPVTGGVTPDTLRLGPLKVPLATAEQPSAPVAESARFGQVAQLLGYQLSQQPAGVTITLYWQAADPDGKDYTVFVHLLDAQGRLVTGHDGPPCQGSYPTGIWEPGEWVADAHMLTTTDLASGVYSVEVGMYLLSSGERLPVILSDGRADAERRLILSTSIQLP